MDSAQLIALLGAEPILDIGSGAGFPGLVLAIITGRPLVLIEPRRRRADFLVAAAADLGLTVRVEQRRVESYVAPPFGSSWFRQTAHARIRLRQPDRLCIVPARFSRTSRVREN